MTRTHRPLVRFLPAFGSLAFAAALAGVLRPAATCLADDPAPAPATQPTIPLFPLTLPATAPTTGPAEAVRFGPATAPATQPATRPAVKVSPEARAELDALRDAYRSLTSLHLAGTIAGDFDINGQSESRKGGFLADYEARPDGASRFRQVTRDGDARPDSPGDADAGTMTLGSTGEKLYTFDPELQQFRSADAPKKKFAAGKMPQPWYLLLVEQNPSLLLALVDDAAAEVLDGQASVDKVDDVKIGDESFPTLRLTDKEGDTVDLSIDPRTHLLRRSVWGERNSLKKSGQPEVNKALVTVDYTESTAGGPVKDEQFAWAPPDGAHEVTAMADAAPGVALAQGGEGSPADALVGKPAPDFKLKGMDGKEVSASDLKGSVVVLDFWATWCGPCRASLPHLNKLYEDKKGDGLKVFALDLKEDQDDVQKGVTELKLTIPVLLDSEGKVAEAYRVNGIPQTVVIGKDGLVKKVFVGSGAHEEIARAVAEAMK